MGNREFRISTIIPLYNGGEFIEQAIVSVLGQRLQPDEIIVVDDGSTDQGPAIVERMQSSHPIVLLRKPNGGQSSARNFGVAHSSGSLIALLDQDDVWYPNHLEELVRPFSSGHATELGWVYSNLDEMDRAGNTVGHAILTNDHDRDHPKRDLIGCMQQDMFILPSASLISRKAFDAVGGFDERLSGYEDDDLFLRILRAGFVNVYLDKPLTRWRLYRDSASYSPRMARSRMIYARKLLAEFPDDPARSMHYARDLLAPRFYPQVVAECRKALRVGDPAAIAESLQDRDFIAGFLPPCATQFSEAPNYLISAVIPLHNGAAYIEQAIKSVFTQTLLPAELIVIDDGSEDDGAQIVDRIAMQQTELPVTLVRQANGGQSSARNLGVSLAHGDLIAFLDQDDIWYSDHLEKLIQPFLESRSRKLGWTYSDLDEIDEHGNMVARSILETTPNQNPKRDLFGCLRQDMFVLPSASLVSRKAFEEVTGFDERLMGYEDDDLFLRLFRAGFDNAFVTEPLSQWRIYPSSSSYSPRMARSREIYARKLLDEYPDDVERNRYFARDLVAPRFFAQMVGEYRRALQNGGKDEIRSALHNMRWMSRSLGGRRRVGAAILLLLVAYRPLARLLFRWRRILSAVWGVRSARRWLLE